MPIHDYTPQQALELFMRKLNGRDPELAARVQAAVNQGKDVQEREMSGPQRKKKVRFYRRTMPYSPEEALGIALEALAAHFIQQPLFLNALIDNMTPAAIGVVDSRYALLPPKEQSVKQERLGTQKASEIELHTETQLLRGTELARIEPETQPLQRIADAQIEQQERNFAKVRELLDLRND